MLCLKKKKSKQTQTKMWDSLLNFARVSQVAYTSVRKTWLAFELSVDTMGIVNMSTALLLSH